MYRVRQALASDFEKVLPLFDCFNNTEIKQEQWLQFFLPVCAKIDSHYAGYLVETEDTNEVVACFGGLLSIRTIRGKNHKICNLTNLVILPEHRSKGLMDLMLKKFIEDKDCHFQTVSPVNITLQTYLRNGFKENLLKLFTVLQTPFSNPFSSKPQIKYNETINTDLLNDTDKLIFNEHQHQGVLHIQYKYNNEVIYCIFKATLYSSYVLNSSFLIRTFTKAWFKVFKKDFFQRKIRLGLLHYCNQPKAFSESLHLLRNELCSKLNVIGLSVNEKYLNRKFFFAIPNNINYSGVYKSDVLQPEDFDTLYTEMIYLDSQHFQL